VSTVAGSCFGALALGGKALLHAHVLYSLGLIACGWVRSLERRGAVQPDGASDGKELRMAALVVAHDEERVIEAAVESLRGQLYPSDLLEVVVIADNCSDRTAERAAAAGATVIERRSGGARGKAQALAFGIDWVLRADRFDAVAVFDADNRADPDFIARLSLRLASGERIVQGFVDAMNPTASWVATASALGFWAIAAVQQEPRERLGLSAPLMGTGWAAGVELCRSELLAVESVTDDLELVARLALLGVRVAYEPRARVRDEKPAKLDQALKQRERWMRGRWSVVERYVPQLLRTALAADSERSTGMRLRAFDACVQLAAPSLLFTSVALGTLAGTELLFARSLPQAARRLSAWIPPPLSLALSALAFAAPAPGLLKYRVPLAAWAVYPLQPFYLLLSVPLSAAGFVRRRAPTWRRTEHGVAE
jgi:cellulose synthase/poly-beta-1,6-N-acetylglucosamine synthase-like glycosyltransferase